MRDLVSGLVLSGLAVVYFFLARGLPAGQDEPGPRAFPFLLALALFALGASIAVRGWRERSPWERVPSRTSISIVLTVLYAAALALVGIVASTLAYTGAMTLLHGQRGWRALAVPVVTTTFIYLAFVVGLGVSPP